MTIADVVQASVQPGRLDEALDIIERSVAPALIGQQATSGLVVVCDRAADQFMLVALAADGVDTATIGAQTRSQRYAELEDLLIAPASARAYEIAQSVGTTGGRVARVFSARLRPGALDLAIGLFQNVVMHAATSQQGFRRGLLLVDRAANLGMSIGLWESADALRASEANGYLQRQLEEFANLLAEPPVARHYEVCVEL